MNPNDKDFLRVVQMLEEGKQIQDMSQEEILLVTKIVESGDMDQVIAAAVDRWMKNPTNIFEKIAEQETKALFSRLGIRGYK
jgi:hypothetical protein